MSQRRAIGRGKRPGPRTFSRVSITALSTFVLASLGLYVSGVTAAENNPAAQWHRAVPGGIVHDSAPATSSGSQSSAATVAVADGKLSVMLVDAPLRDVMARIARQSGVTIRVAGADHPVKLTDSFVGLPLEDGLRRLLRGGSHVFVYSDSGPNPRLEQVIVMSIRSGEPEVHGEAPITLAEALKDRLDLVRIVDEFKALTGSNVTGPETWGSTVVHEHIGLPMELTYSRDAIREELQRLTDELETRPSHRTSKAPDRAQ